MEKDIIKIKKSVEDYIYYMNAERPEKRPGIISDRIMPFYDHFYYGKSFRNRAFQIFISFFIIIIGIILLILLL